jgi:hypothetical protein
MHDHVSKAAYQTYDSKDYSDYRNKATQRWAYAVEEVS